MSAESDHERFLRRWEPYEVAKQRGENVTDLAVMVLSEIRHKSGVSAVKDRDANVRAMHGLMGPLFTEAQIRDMYDQLRKDAGLE
jgi:hypothetical protein